MKQVKYLDIQKLKKANVLTAVLSIALTVRANVTQKGTNMV